MWEISKTSWFALGLAVVGTLVVAACDGSAKDKGKASASATASPPAASSPSATGSAPASASAAETPKPPVEPDSDPFRGKFTLEDATQGLAGTGKLVAELDTAAGKLTCTLFDDKAPLTVANFVGLARGLRPFKDPKTEKWIKKPLFDGSVFHRVIGRFMIQGGCPKGDGTGNGSYFFQDEIWEGATHDKAGQLCMANSGPDTNSTQFFITDGAAKHLDKRGHTIFGECKPTSVVRKIGNAKTDNKDHPITPQVLNKVTIRRTGK